MKVLGMYAIEIKGPDEMDDEDGTDYTMNLVDGVLTDMNNDPMNDVVSRIQAIDSRLSVEIDVMSL